MSVKPLDLQVNINSTIELSKVEGAKLARWDGEQRSLDEKLNKQYETGNKRVTEMSDSEASNKTNNEEIDNHLANSSRKKNKEQKYRKNKKRKDQIQSGFTDSHRDPSRHKIDLLV